MKKIMIAIITLTAICFGKIWLISETGQTNLKAVICLPTTQQVYDTTDDTFKSAADVNYANRALIVAEDGNNLGMYYIDIPAGLTDANTYLIRVYDTGDGTLDTNDLPLAQGGNFEFHFDGGTEITTYTLSADVNAVNTVIAREIESYAPAKEQTVNDSNDSLKADLDTLLAGVNVATIDGEVPITKSEFAAEVVTAMDSNSTKLDSIATAIENIDVTESLETYGVAKEQTVLDVNDVTQATINTIDFDAIVEAIFARTGVTQGGNWTFAKSLKVMNAWAAGLWRDKAGVSGVQELLDPDDGVTVILEMRLSSTSPYKTITLRI